LILAVFERWLPTTHLFQTRKFFTINICCFSTTLVMSLVPT
jgi:hypothetical protein